MKKDISEMMDCNFIFMLKNWKQSEGATIEHYLAEKLNFKIIYE